MNTEFQLLPERASSFAGPVDTLLLVLAGITLLFTLLIAGTILLFIVKYRRREPQQVGSAVPNPISLEIAWTVVPLVIAMFIFVWATGLFVHLAASPSDATEIDVVGKQWMWKLQHPGGQQEINELHVPRGRPIRLVMTSQDVVHSFFIPAFRIKQDVLPGRYSSQWFVATATGEYHLFCSQYCGTWHSHMVGRVVVMEPADYDRWLEGTSTGADRAIAGRALFDHYGCARNRGPVAIVGNY